MKDDKIYLEHILECIGRIEQYSYQSNSIS